MIEFILEPLEYEFFRHGVLAALMVGSLCGLIGTYVILRGMSYVGHGLSHAAFGGAVVGYALNLNFYAGAGLMGLLAALLIHGITKNGRIKLDAAIGIVTTAMFALGVIIISQVRTFRQSFEAALFGHILGITQEDLLLIATAGSCVMVTMFVMYRPLLFSTFDEEAARIFGIATGAVQLTFSLLLTFSIIASMNVVGVTMIAATLITPAITARLLTSSFHRLLIYSWIIGAVTGVSGMYLSYVFNAASGPAIVLFGAALFCFVSLGKFMREKYLLRVQREGVSCSAESGLHNQGQHSYRHANESPPLE
ncbi:MAG TPA: metal ABC transporter permease [Nitrosospira sp.]|nr:metal ABC transporter permease [Nitrosospira sp.]